MTITSPFSYYGGKSKLAHLYPRPRHDRIIEPFAGSAAYAFRYWEREVIVNDLDPDTYSIWEFLTSPTAADDVERLVPAEVTAGQRVSDILPPDAPWGLFGLLRAAANQGTQGAAGQHNVITEHGALAWSKRLKRKLLDVVIPRVRHWRVSGVDYLALPNGLATWFIDPPYANAAGARYRTNTVNHCELAAWCRSREGQVIVCENEGATWLPFRLLAERRGYKTSHQKSRAREVYCELNQLLRQ